MGSASDGGTGGEARGGQPLELWGGIECSHVLIRGRVRDQLAETGHLGREADLDRIAGLGVRALRYPILWAHAARRDGAAFGWHARRFERLRRLGLRPIVGFLHHGVAPGGETLTEPGVIARFSEFAEAAARRFPWIEDYTPINEPVTTARLACLYGHWHPHTRDTGVFLRNVVAAAEATAAAMAGIRRVNPRARLVQTEDVGRIFATPRLAEQAAYENERRFLGFDLLAGRVGRDHPFWRELLAAGVAPAALDRLAAEPCLPDVIGIDQYLTSDRFLDDRLERHPHEPVGGNGRQAYVDVAAAHLRALRPELGLLPRLRELHARYGLPIAVTEVHNGCTREEQLRWLVEAWEAAGAARAEGMDVRAVTLWSMFGARDWNTLLSETRGHYESGAFDVRCDPPRPTALAAAAAALARDGAWRHPLLDRPGWWRDEPAGEGPPALTLAAAPEDLDWLAACCARRRITAAAAEDGGPAPTWGELTVRRTAEGLRFNFRPAAGGRALEVEAPREAEPFCAADAALDLAVDGLAGRVRLAAVGPHCQYRILPATPGQPDPAPVGAEARPIAGHGG